MKNEKQVDEALQNALQEIEGNEYKPSGIMHEILIDAFKTKVKFVLMLIWGYSLVFLALAIYWGYKAFTVTDMRELILYSAGTIIAAGILMTLKIIYLQMANRASLEREIKRLEIRIAKLQTKN